MLCSHFNIEDGKNIHFSILCFIRSRNKNTTKIQKKVCAVPGDGAVTDPTCRKWFVKFRDGDFSLEDAPQLGRPVEVDSDEVKTLTEHNQLYTM